MQHQQTQIDNRENIKVIIRIRPKVEREKEQQCTFLCVEGNSLIAINRNEQKQFTYDCIASETSTQVDLFNECARPICDYTLEGYNGTIFAYGQTGSGKTYTLLGPKFSKSCLTPQQITQSLESLSGSSLDDGDIQSLSMCDDESIGVLPRVLMYLFDKIKDNNHINLSCSFLEIYKEQLNDLLDIHANKDIAIREIKNSIIIDGLSKLKISSTEEALSIVMKGTKLRHIAPTGMNKESSRSHAVFSIYIENKFAEGSDKKTKTKKSVFHIIDLAGSERQKASETTGERLKEGNLINKSLMQLGFVIKNLTDTSNQTKHVHYRDSKLTHLLKDSLGGNAKTCLIANISPANFNIQETISTLMFAQRAKMIKNKAIINEEFSNESLFRDEIKKLKDKYDSIKSQNAYLLSLIEKNRNEGCRHSSFTSNVSSNNNNNTNAFNKTLDSVEDEIESMVHDICSKEDEVKALTKENDYLKDKIQKYELDMKIIEKELKDYKDLSKSLTKDNQTYEKEIKEYLMSNAYISQRVSQLESILSNKEQMLNSEIETLKFTIEENKKMFSMKEENIAGLNKDINNYMTLINQKEQKISEMITLNNQTEMKLKEEGIKHNDHKQEMDQLNETISKMSIIINEKDSIIKQNDDKIEMIKDKGKQLIGQYDEKITKLTNDNIQMKEMLNERTNKNSSLLKLINDIKIRKSKYETKLSIANEQIRTDIIKIIKLESELNETTEQNKKLRNDYSKVAEELDCLMQNKGSMNKAQMYSKIKIDNQKLRDEVINLQKSLRMIKGLTSNNNIETLPNLLVAKEADVNEARRHLHNAIDSIKNYLNENNDSEILNQSLSEGKTIEEKFSYYFDLFLNYIQFQFKNQQMYQDELEIKDRKIDELNREIALMNNNDSISDNKIKTQKSLTMTSYKKTNSNVINTLLQSDLSKTVTKKKYSDFQLLHQNENDSSDNKENTIKMNKPVPVDETIFKLVQKD